VTYTVWVFSSKELDTYFAEVEHVDFTAAVRAFKFQTSNVAAKAGLTQKVIIVDSGDEIVAEWIHGEGLVWPKEEPK